MNHSFRFNYATGINSDTWEEAPLTYSDKDMAGVYASHYDPIVITTNIRVWRQKGYWWTKVAILENSSKIASKG